MGNRYRNTRISSTAAVIIAALLALAILSCLPAAADPDDLASRSRQAAEITRQIEDLDRELSISTEAYNRIKGELDAITEEVDLTRQQLYEIRQNLKERKELLSGRAVVMYKNGRTTMLEVLLQTSDFNDFLSRADYAARVAESDARLIQRIQEARDTVAEMESRLVDAQRQQQGLLQQASAKRMEIETRLSERHTLLASVNEDIQRLLEEQQRRRAAESAVLEARAQQVLVAAPDATIAKTAMNYLGIPYHWAGEGPGRCPTGEHRICFDCSGLVQYVYRLHGISIPRNSATQYNRSARIPLAQAVPGDLVFFGMPPHHVGLYLGDDMYIHAPRTGDVVKVNQLSSRRDFSGVGRYGKSE